MQDTSDWRMGPTSCVSDVEELVGDVRNGKRPTNDGIGINQLNNKWAQHRCSLLLKWKAVLTGRVGKMADITVDG